MGVDGGLHTSNKESLLCLVECKTKVKMPCNIRPRNSIIWKATLDDHFPPYLVAQTFNFLRVPLEHQLLAVNMMTLVCQLRQLGNP